MGRPEKLGCWIHRSMLCLPKKKLRAEIFHQLVPCWAVGRIHGIYQLMSSSPVPPGSLIVLDSSEHQAWQDKSQSFGESPQKSWGAGHANQFLPSPRRVFLITWLGQVLWWEGVLNLPTGFHESDCMFTQSTGDFQLIFSFLTQRSCLQILVDSVCLWEEGKSMAFYSAILLLSFLRLGNVLNSLLILWFYDFFFYHLYLLLDLEVIS